MKLISSPSEQNRFPLAHTFSIVARDPETGQMGVAVQSHWFSVGSIVTWAEAGVGAIATQAMVEVSYGPLGLAELKDGKSPQQALSNLLAKDSGKELRQVAIVDASGEVAAHTGSRCIAEAGQIIGKGFSVQANMMLNASVWPSMAEAYQSSTGSLAERLLSALEAGQEAGGDVRGQQSASLLIVASERTGRPWEGKLYDLRVEDHPYPIAELRHLVKLQQAYLLMNQGDRQLGEGDIESALSSYRSAASIAPHIQELPFWHAVTLAELGKLEDALPIFHSVFQKEPLWAVLLERLPAAGLLKNDPQMLKQILSQRP